MSNFQAKVPIQLLWTHPKLTLYTNHGMKRFVSTALMLLAASALSPREFASCPNGPHTLYSQRAVSFDNDLVKLQSPDREKILIVKRVWDSTSEEGVYFSFTVKAAGRSLRTRLEGYTNGEVVWSPDSSAFAVTATNNCGATAFVFDVTPMSLKAVEVDSVVQKAFGMPVKCEYRFKRTQELLIGWILTRY